MNLENIKFTSIIKKCPYCGRDSWIGVYIPIDKDCKYNVRCECGASSSFKETQYLAIESWNLVADMAIDLENHNGSC